MTITHDDDGTGRALLVRLGLTVDVLQPGQSMRVAVPVDTSQGLTVSFQQGIQNVNREQQ